MFVSTSPTSGLAQSTCDPTQKPVFQPVLAPLANWLGAAMGQPACSHIDSATGDLVQPTSTGLAYVRGQTGTPSFTNGSSHWAWVNQAPRCWSGAAVDPPPSDEPLPQISAAAEDGRPDPWVAGETLAIRIAPAPYSVSANDVLSALQQRCLPLIASGEESDSGAPDGPLSTIQFTDARAAPGGAASGSIAVFVSPFLASRTGGSVLVGNVAVRPPSGLTPEQTAAYGVALADALGP